MSRQFIEAVDCIRWDVWRIARCWYSFLFHVGKNLAAESVTCTVPLLTFWSNDISFIQPEIYITLVDGKLKLLLKNFLSSDVENGYDDYNRFGATHYFSGGIVMDRCNWDFFAAIKHFQLPFAIGIFRWWKQRRLDMLVLSFGCLQKWHLNVPLGLDSDEFVSRSVPIENFGHFFEKKIKIQSVNWGSNVFKKLR